MDTHLEYLKAFEKELKIFSIKEIDNLVEENNFKIDEIEKEEDIIKKMLKTGMLRVIQRVKDEKIWNNNLKKYPILRDENRYDPKNKNTRLLFGIDVYNINYIYGNSIIFSPSNNITAVYFQSKEGKEKAEELIDLIAYIEYRVLYMETGNKELDEKLRSLYNYGISNEFFELEKEFYERINFYKTNNYIVNFNKIHNPILLSLYHTSIKQPEPLSKCVFLFRIIEYAFHNLEIFGYNYSYSKKGKKINQYKEYINYMIGKSLNYKYIPIPIRKHLDENKIENQVTIWKRTVKQYIKQLEKKGEDVGEKVYKYGRCGIAHGGNKDDIILHNYGTSYFEIIKINKILELICRYIIEYTNPKIKQSVRIRFK